MTIHRAPRPGKQHIYRDGGLWQCHSEGGDPDFKHAILAMTFCARRNPTPTRDTQGEALFERLREPRATDATEATGNATLEP